MLQRGGGKEGKCNLICNWSLLATTTTVVCFLLLRAEPLILISASTLLGFDDFIYPIKFCWHAACNFH